MFAASWDSNGNWIWSVAYASLIPSDNVNVKIIVNSPILGSTALSQIKIPTYGENKYYHHISCTIWPVQESNIKE